jgi:V-type H+-transporting ATPase subunit C
MAPTTSYALLSLPLSTFDTGDKDEALNTIKATITSDNGQVLPFAVPSFKIGTLDALVQQADDLAKLDSACEGLVTKVADSLRSLLDDNQDKIAQQQMVNDSACPPSFRSLLSSRLLPLLCSSSTCY